MRGLQINIILGQFLEMVKSKRYTSEVNLKISKRVGALTIYLQRLTQNPRIDAENQIAHIYLEAI